MSGVWVSVTLVVLAAALAVIVRIRRRPRRQAVSNRLGDPGDALELRLLLSGPHRVLYCAQSPFQQVLLLENREVRLYLDGQLQFSSSDEACYHEALVHPAMSLTHDQERVLVLGGGDGLALREVLRYSAVQAIDLVDIDPLVLRLARRQRSLVRLNGGSLGNPRVKVWQQDAVKYLEEARSSYGVIIIDLPDPTDDQLARLYTRELFTCVGKLLQPGGILVTQAFSTDCVPRSFWIVERTLAAVGLYVLSYHLEVPTFGDWGFHLAAHSPLSAAQVEIRVPCRGLPTNTASLFQFDAQVQAYRAEAPVHSLQNPVLRHSYVSEMESAARQD